MRYSEIRDADCAIAQALGVVGDWWTLLVIRDLAGGINRFSALAEELGVSRKVLAERLTALVHSGVVERRRYREHPPRYEYHLTERGKALLPVLIALQDWGDRFVFGDGSVSATAAASSREAKRVQGLVGRHLPEIRLPSISGRPKDPVSRGRWTVLYCFPGAYAPGTMAYPPGWAEIPGATGCTVESCTFRDRLDEFARRGAAIRGVSTQPPYLLRAFAEHAQISFPLLSDQEHAVATALRLPSFRVAGTDRLKRLTLVTDRDRRIRGALYPIRDPAGSVQDALALIDELDAQQHVDDACRDKTGARAC
jgi:DNA-binding HxlR family transcriptional regulator/peroxiredoxin